MPSPRKVNKLSVERVREILSYDPENGVIVRIARASRYENPYLIGKPHVNWQIIIDGVGNSMGRIAWALYHNEWPTGKVLFRDGDPKNLRIANLYVPEKLGEFDYSTLDGRSAYGKAHRKKFPDLHRDKALRKTFGISFEQYQEMLKDQDFVCAICKKPETEIGRHGEIKLLAVDHDHQTGRIRNLVCAACNKGIGWFKEDIATMKSAIAYLEHHAFQSQLTLLATEIQSTITVGINATPPIGDRNRHAVH